MRVPGAVAETLMLPAQSAASKVRRRGRTAGAEGWTPVTPPRIVTCTAQDLGGVMGARLNVASGRSRSSSFDADLA